jgi:cysteine desulfurase/selenocysteine lyase
VKQTSLVRASMAAVRALADASGYFQPNGERRSWLLIDGAQLVPGSFTDVHALGADYLAFSFHKLLAPFGVGVLYAREHLLNRALPFLYGGDMIAEGRVFPNHVEYNALPWKYSAGTPNILGAVVSGQALRLLVDLALTPKASGVLRDGHPGRARRGPVGHAPGRRVEPDADRPGARRARSHRRDHHLRAA